MVRRLPARHNPAMACKCELERRERVPGLGEALLRPVQPDDADAVNRFFARLTRDDVRARFFSVMPRLPERYLQSLLAADFDHDVAFLLVDPIRGDILGVVRLADIGGAEGAEVAVTVRSDLKHRGIGALLLARVLACARAHGTREVHGDVLADNRACIGLARKLGFSLVRSAVEPHIVRASLRLGAAVSP